MMERATRKRKRVDDLEKVKPNTAKKRRQRANIKKDEARPMEARRKDRERKRLSRLARKKHLDSHPHLKIAEQEKKKLQMRNYRLKITSKEVSSQLPESGKQLSAKKREVRKKDRLRKQKNQKQQEKKRKKEVKRVQNWRMRVKLQKSQGNDQDKSPFTSPASEKRAVKKTKQSLPQTPRRRSRVLQKLLESHPILSSTSRQQKMGRSLLKSLGEQLNTVKYSGGASSTRRAACKILKDVINKSGQYGSKSLRKELGVRKRKSANAGNSEGWEPSARKKRKDSIPEEEKEQVKEFYLSPNISREVPDKREAIKVKDKDKVLIVQRHYMSMAIQDAYEEYKRAYPDDKLGLTSFYKLRPKQVKKVAETNRRTCLCQKCCNAALKAEALKKFTSTECSSDLAKSVITTKRDVIKATLCAYDTEHPRAACLNRTCSQCNAHLIITHYDGIVSPNKGKQITWNSWEHITIMKDDTPKKVMSCVTKTSTLEEFMEAYASDLEELPGHLFRADWQHQQMKLCIQGLQEDEACICMDYAENYQCRFQGEVQSAFFDQNQVTIHPMIAYYKERMENEELLVKHAIIGITDDHQKGALGVKMFEKEAITIIGKREGEESSDCARVHRWLCKSI